MDLYDFDILLLFLKNSDGSGSNECVTILIF
jgi:hypothetical protein